MATASKGPPPVKQLPPEICTVAFDSLGTSEAELKSNVVQMVESVGGLALLKKSPADIAAFMDSVQAKMKANPYHNFSHICDVTQFMYTALVQTKIAERLSPLQRTALVLAAICHDLEHPGLSNVYQVNEKTEYAVRYNNESPLENHHLEVARALVTQHELLAALSGPEVDEFWTLVRQCILGTDMAKHGTMTKELDEFLGAEGADPLANARVLQLGLSILLKCADISNQARPFSVSQTWNDVVYQEFYHEGDLDAKAGREVNPLYNRETNVISKSTIGFITFVVEPLFRLFVKFLERIQLSDDRISIEPLNQCLRSVRARAVRPRAKLSPSDSSLGGSARAGTSSRTRRRTNK